MGPCDDPRLAMYEPDAIVEWTDKDYQKHLVVIEFTRSLREDAGTHEAKVAEKTQAYQSTIRHLQRMLGIGTKVQQQTFVMSCHWAIKSKDWDQDLSWWGMKPKDCHQIKLACMTACVKGNHKIANARRSHIETTRAEGIGVAGPGPRGPSTGVG
eukprot:3935054-Rhodomonas_salina.1